MDDKLLFSKLNLYGYGTAYYEDSKVLSIRWEDAKPENILTGSDKGSGLHLQNGDESYYSHFDKIDAGLVDEFIRRIPIAGNTAAKPPLKPLVYNDYKHKIKIKSSEVRLDEKIEVLKNIYQLLKGFDPRIMQVIMNYGEKQKNIRIISSDGRVSSEQRDYTVFGLSVIAHEGNDIQTASEIIGGICGFELIKESDLKGIALKVAKLAVDKLSAPYLKAGEMPVVIASEAGGTMIHEAIGHSLEADLVQKGISPHFKGKIGAQVASELVTISDDPTLPGKRGSYFVDDEGVESRPVLLVENGILRDYLYDRYTALKDNKKSNAHGRRESYQCKPIPRMANTFISPGKTKREDIISSLKKGLLVRKMGGGQVNTATGDFVFEVEEGYLVEDGIVKNLVRGATLLGNGPKALMDIDMVADDIGWGVGTCGKESQGVPVSDGQPTLRIKKILVGGNT